jgi:hypothetical protein
MARTGRQGMQAAKKSTSNSRHRAGIHIPEPDRRNASCHAIRYFRYRVLAMAPISKVEQVRELHHERAVHRLSIPRIAVVVVDDIQVTQRMVNDVEPDVRAD